MRFEPGKFCAVASALVMGALVLSPSALADDLQIGVRGGVYTDAGDPFLGVDLLTRISDTRWFFNPSLEYVFVDPGDLATLNLDVHYDLDIDRGDRYVWLGGGPALVFRDRGNHGRHGDGDGDDTDVGLNLLGGIGWRLESMVPYLQVKALIAEDSEVVLAAGVRF